MQYRLILVKNSSRSRPPLSSPSVGLLHCLALSCSCSPCMITNIDTSWLSSLACFQRYEIRNEWLLELPGTTFHVIHLPGTLLTWQPGQSSNNFCTLEKGTWDLEVISPEQCCCCLEGSLEWACSCDYYHLEGGRRLLLLDEALFVIVDQFSKKPLTTRIPDLMRKVVLDGLQRTYWPKNSKRRFGFI